MIAISKSVCKSRNMNCLRHKYLFVAGEGSQVKALCLAFLARLTQMKWVILRSRNKYWGLYSPIPQIACRGRHAVTGFIPWDNISARQWCRYEPLGMHSRCCSILCHGKVINAISYCHEVRSSRKYSTNNPHRFHFPYSLIRLSQPICGYRESYQKCFWKCWDIATAARK